MPWTLLLALGCFCFVFVLLETFSTQKKPIILTVGSWTSNIRLQDLNIFSELIKWLPWPLRGKYNVSNMDSSTFQALVLDHLCLSPVFSPPCSGIWSDLRFPKHTVFPSPLGLVLGCSLWPEHPQAFLAFITTVCWGCHNKIPQARWFINHRNLFLIVLKAGSTRWECQQMPCPVRALFLAHTRNLTATSSHDEKSSVFLFLLL